MDICTVEKCLHEVEIEHPGTGKFIGLILTVDSIDCLEAKKVERKTISKMNARRIANSKKNKKIEEPVFTDEEIDQNETDVFLAVVKGWKWVDDADGDPGEFMGEQPEFTTEKFAELLELAPWIKPQIDAKLSDASNFFIG